MKKIPKKQFDEVVCLSRDIWVNGNMDVLKERIEVAKMIPGIDWLATIDFVDCIIRESGLLPGADNEILYLLLRVLGWEVVEDVEKHSTD